MKLGEKWAKLKFGLFGDKHRWGWIHWDEVLMPALVVLMFLLGTFALLVFIFCYRG